MAKPKDKNRQDALFQRITAMCKLSMQTNGGFDLASDNLYLDSIISNAIIDDRKNPRMKKFRFQLLQQWLMQLFEPCRLADIGGGKGLLSYLLQEDGWQVTVIDPVKQDLPHKYKDIRTGERIFIEDRDDVVVIDHKFEEEMAKDFDLLIGLHAHGCNIKIINGATNWGAGFLLIPCCIIDEPVYPILGVSWLECLANYAILNGHVIYPMKLNFKGQNIGFYSLGLESRVKFRSASSVISSSS